jgi:endoglucanase
MFFLCGLLAFCSCAKVDVTPNAEVTQEVPLQMEKVPVLNYSVPKMMPSVFINREGYSTEEEKVVIVKGENLPDTFRVVDAKTETVVYTGDLQEKGSYSKAKEYNSYGDFSEVEEEGEYYIECDVIGRSYTFQIAHKIEEKIFEESLQNLKTKFQQLTLKASQDNSNLTILGEGREDWMLTLMYLLLAYEIYPYTQDLEDSQQIPLQLEVAEKGIQGLLYFQDEKTGGVGGRSYLFAALLAKYSYLTQKYDSTLANKVLNLADQAWRFAEKNRKNKVSLGDETYRMSAAAELYRATGQYSYRNVVLEYGNEMLNAEKQISVSGGSSKIGDTVSEEMHRGQTLAKITYISTTKKVNVELCNLFISQLMEQAEEITAKLDGTFSVSDFENTRQGDQLFWHLILLSVVEYAITNHEYGQVIENQYHFLCGRNDKAYRYWRDETVDKEENEQANDDLQIRANPVWTAGFVMLLSEILTYE